MNYFILFLYGYAAINTLWISWLLYKSENGEFRKLSLFFFLAVSFAWLARGLFSVFGWPPEIAAVIAMLPVSTSLTLITLFLHRTHIKNKDINIEVKNKPDEPITNNT